MKIHEKWTIPRSAGIISRYCIVPNRWCTKLTITDKLTRFNIIINNDSRTKLLLSPTVARTNSTDFVD
jgi:hypothetical protein